jgi:outer membrane protein assembly factor BamB
LADLAGVVHVLAPDGSPRFRYVSGADYLLAGGVSDGQGTVYFGDPAGVVHRLRPDGTGQPVFEAPRSLQARPSFDRRGNLYIPSTGHQVYVFHNRAPA